MSARGRRTASLPTGLVGVFVVTALLATNTLLAVDTTLLSSARALAKRLEPVIDDAFARPPIVERSTAAERERAAQERVERVIPQVRLEARGRAWASMGFGSTRAPRGLYALFSNGVSRVAIDAEKKRLLVDEDLLQGEDRVVVEGEDGADADEATLLMMAGVRRDEPLVAHGLVQLLHLERMERDAIDETTDGLLARFGFSESEASLVALRYLFGGMGLADAVLEPGVKPQDFLNGDLVPRGLSRLSGVEASLARFVYEESYAIASERFAEGGWAYVAPPRTSNLTTRDLLHRETSGTPLATWPTRQAPEGWSLADSDRFGEQCILTLISLLTGKDNIALQAGEGWLGDRLDRWESSAAGATHWRTRWASERDRKEFAYSWQRAIEARFPRNVWIVRGEWKISTGAAEQFAVRETADEVETWIASAESLALLLGESAP